MSKYPARAFAVASHANARPSVPQRVLRRGRLPAAVSAVLATAAGTPVVAQDDGAVDVILVTAMRREQSIQEIPLNIASFDGELLEQREIGDLAELGRNVPGLYVVDQGKRTANQIVVRGLNLDPVTSSEAVVAGGGTVATYVGEIPLYVDLNLSDMDRVEVLLGPQGTLYGAGTLGGAIRYIPRLPELGETSMTFRGSTFDLAESDSFGFRGGAVFNVPLGENLALRATIDYFDDPGFIDNPYLVREPGVSDPEPDFTNPADVAANLYRKNDVDTEQTLYGRIGLRWQPNDVLDANFTYHYQNMEVGGRNVNHAFSFGTGLYESAVRYLEPNERRTELLSAEITADLGFAELTSATGMSWYDDDGQRDQTDLLITLEYGYEQFPSFSAFTRDDDHEDTFSQEIRLVSQGDGRLNWIAGLFYLKQEGEGFSREYTPHYDEWLGGNPRPDNLEYFSALFEDLKEQALFGEIGYEITDRWQVTVGGRWYDYTYETLSDFTLPLLETAFGDLPPDQAPLELEFNSQEDDGFLYKVNTSYQFTDDLMGYVTISEGYRIGASNGIAPCDVENPDQQTVCALPDEIQYFPDKTTNYEIGVRSQWLDRRLTLNGALYFIDWKDPQLTATTVNGSQPITKNGLGAETKGLEISVDALVTDRLSISVSYAHTQAELSDPAPNLLREFVAPFGIGGFCPGPDCFGPDPAIYTDGLPGDRLPGSPENQGTFHLTYNLPLQNGRGLDITYGFSAIGDIITKTGMRAGGERLGGFTVHFASAVLHSGPWTFGVYGQNLFNKYAVTGVRSTPYYVQTVPDVNGDPVRARSYFHHVLRPREIGFRFTYDLDLQGRN